MVDATELRALIASITAGPVTRELEDRVLLACGVIDEIYESAEETPGKSGTVTFWVRPSPLSNLQDAKLFAVPEGWRWSMQELEHPNMDLSTLFYASLEHRKELHRYGRQNSNGQPDPATALVLAGLKAREQEAEG